MEEMNLESIKIIYYYIIFENISGELIAFVEP